MPNRYVPWKINKTLEKKTYPGNSPTLYMRQLKAKLYLQVTKKNIKYKKYCKHDCNVGFHKQYYLCFQDGN